MGRETFSVSSYESARQSYGVTHDHDVTRDAERRARDTGRLSEIVDPGINPIRRSKIRLNPHQGKWIATLGCPMDIEVSCDTTGSMGGEVDTEMKVLPELYEAVANMLPGYDPQLCLGIFGDCYDDFVMCRPQFEMEAPKIVNYLKEMAPQRNGHGNHGEDPQYAMFARAYLTDAYTNRIGLKGYHFIVTDEPCHDHLRRDEIQRIFGENVFKEELAEMKRVPTLEQMVKKLKKQTHQFVLLLDNYQYSDTQSIWYELCGYNSVIMIPSTRQLPAVISAIIGLTEGTLDVAGIDSYLAEHGLTDSRASLLAMDLAKKVDVGAQAKLRHSLPHPVPKADDIFENKDDIWPIQAGETPAEGPAVETSGGIDYL